MTDPTLAAPAELPAADVVSTVPSPKVVPEVVSEAAPAIASGPVETKRAVERVLLHMPVDVRSASLVTLAVLASVFALKWAAAVFIPLMVALLATYALAPVVDFLERLRVPRWLAAAVLLMGLGGAFGWTAYSLAGSASQLIDSLPVATQKLRLAMRSKASTNVSPIESVQKAAAQIEQAATDNSAQVAARRGVTRVTVERPPFNVRDYLLTGTVGLLDAAGQLTLVMFLTFFALGSGNTFRRKLVKITGPSLEKKKITVHVLDDITQHIQRYLLVQILSSVLVGVTTSLAFWGLGLENAAVWGIIAAITNLIPYIGSLVVMGAGGLVAFLQFGSIEMALTIGGVSLFIHTLVGNLLVPYLTSRTSRMNPLAVFVGVIFWGWLWGIWGLLLGIPITMVIKAICDHVEDLQPLGELLGD